MYFELDGTFPNHEANPIEPANLVDLQQKVRRCADLGLAFDGDADRCFVIDQDGDPEQTPSAITALIASRSSPAIWQQHHSQPDSTARCQKSSLKMVVLPCEPGLATHSSKQQWLTQMRSSVVSIQGTFTLGISGGLIQECWPPFTAWRHWVKLHLEQLFQV